MTGLDWHSQMSGRRVAFSSNAVVGESSLDRLACALGGKTVLNYILSTVQTMLQNRKGTLFVGRAVH